MITLYHFPVSHYCEKVRWALLYKRLPHRCKTLLPGLHRKKMKKLTGQNSVPVLTEGKQAIAGSSLILSYLDEVYPRFALSPEGEAGRSCALKWEDWADSEIGPAVRVLMYSVLTNYPDLMISIMGQNGPWYGSFYLKKGMSKIIPALKAAYKIYPENIESSTTILIEAKNKVIGALNKKPFLVGETFSRADLAVAALFAPVFRISQYGLEWPNGMPSELSEIEAKFIDLKPWVETLYRDYHP